MAKTKHNASIVSINRVTGNTFVLSGNEIAKYDILKKGKSKEFYISYLEYRDIATSNVDINRTVPDEEIMDAIVLKTYEELSLEPDGDYKINYMESQTVNSDTRLYNVFVINNAILKNELAEIAKNTKYIDYVGAIPFLFGSLYKRNILAPNDVECFLYLQMDDAFLVIYNNGEYFESRSIRYNLSFIYDKFCEKLGNRIDSHIFFENLKNHGLELDNDLERDILIQIFDDMSFYLGDMITSLSRINNINIKTIYVGSDLGVIKGIDIFVEDRIGLNYKDLDFSVALNQKDFSDLTQIDVLMMLSAQDYLQDKNDDFNYSPYLRPPPLSQRSSGKLFGIIFAVLVAGLAYPTYQYTHGYLMQKETEEKTAEFTEKDAERSRVNDILNSISKQIADIQKDIEKEDKVLVDRENKLNAMYDKKVNYPMKSFAIYDITKLTTNRDGMIHSIKNTDSNLTFSVRTKTEKKMTELLRDISLTGGYSVDTKSIILDENQTISYESNISIRMK
ncbi:hypothetical protein F1B92_06180 [Campylobacter sp. FMV-PI01]|uniref:Uncharacterized protein n=1 Tax=Campylobacter portucalensis TaxID=2608384 RepID=A0A6L5WJY8_9BACT|nr:hypothetical protein [Campylobacter portucalensis]MSN96752.1 hypothetical protein [Campylobacter portucalensis]